MSILLAAGTFGSPGIVMMSPVRATTNPAPFEILTFLTVSSKSFGAPRSFGSSESEYCVFAIHTGTLSIPFSTILFIEFFASFVKITSFAP